MKICWSNPRIISASRPSYVLSLEAMWSFKIDNLDPSKRWLVQIECGCYSKKIRMCAGIGAIVRNKEGNVMAIVVYKRTFFGNMEFSEAEAVLNCSNLALEVGLTPLIVESNCLNIVNHILKRIIIRCEIGLWYKIYGAQFSDRNKLFSSYALDRPI